MWRNLKMPDALACEAGDSPDFSELLGPGQAGPEHESLVLDRLAYLSAHEVGHTIGLMHNWAATTFGWGSVMDYLAPNIQWKASAGGSGEFDLSDAYPHDIGSYDRLAIQWGYSVDGDPAVLDRIVREVFQGNLLSHRRRSAVGGVRLGADPVAWLATTQRLRRAILERFGAAQLAPGEWVYTLQERFSLAYLYHRFGIQAAQRYVGGQYLANAVAGDGQVPVAWVPAAKQKEALDLLVAAIAPENLDIPDRILAVLAAPPSGTRASREQFPSEAGDSFSLWTAARTLVSLVVEPLLETDRVARLTLPASRDAPTLDALLSRLVSSTWEAPADASPRRSALRRISQRVVIDGLMDLAARPQAPNEVRAAVHARLERLEKQLHQKHSADPATEAHLRLAESDLAEFFEKPEVRKSRPARPAAPPGRPIGQ
jgi:hypothetical protein